MNGMRAAILRELFYFEVIALAVLDTYLSGDDALRALPDQISARNVCRLLPAGHRTLLRRWLGLGNVPCGAGGLR